MTKSNLNENNTRKLIKQFCDKVFHLKQIHYMFCELFHKENAQFLMERTAPSFFFDLNQILINYFILEAAKLTGPATTQKEDMRILL